MITKKGVASFAFSIAAFGMLALIAIFSVIFIYEVGRTEILDPILNATLTIEQQTNVSAALQTHAQDLKTDYDNLEIPYDIFFLALWTISFVSTVGLALKTRKTGVLTFLGSLFWGMMGLLLIIFFFDQVQTWFFTNIFDAVFNDITLDIPIMTYYFANIGWISAVWFLLLLLVNQIDLTVRFDRGRIEE